MAQQPTDHRRFEYRGLFSLICLHKNLASPTVRVYLWKDTLVYIDQFYHSVGKSAPEHLHSAGPEKDFETVVRGKKR